MRSSVSGEEGTEIMARASTVVERYVCKNCHVTHAGTRVQVSPAEYEPPESCGACGGSEFVWIEHWVADNG
jgi:ribosomal protein S27AE